MRAVTRLGVLFALSIVLAGCGSKGDTGPAGVAGPAGPAGPPGSPNVIYSAWFSPSTWTLVTSFGVQERTFDMAAAGLTQAVVDNGVVLVYIKFVGFSGAIIQMPVTIVDQDRTYQFRASVGNVRALYSRTSNSTTDPGVIGPSNQVRYVLIPGGVADGAARTAGKSAAQFRADLAQMPYAEVCRTFGIPE